MSMIWVTIGLKELGLAVCGMTKATVVSSVAVVILAVLLKKEPGGVCDNSDCWWRCMTYLQSCGADYSAEATRALAKDYWGDDYSDAYYRMHAANDTQLALMCKEYLSNSFLFSLSVWNLEYICKNSAN